MQDIDLKIMYGNQNRNISQIFTVQKMDCLRDDPFQVDFKQLRDSTAPIAVSEEAPSTSESVKNAQR